MAGLNSRVGELDIADNESPDLLNVEFVLDGFRTRAAETWYDKDLAGLSHNICGIVDGYNHIIAVTTAGKAYTLAAAAWTERKTGLSTALAAIPSFASYNGLDMMVNGSAYDNPQSWNGTTWADLGGSPPKADDIEVWRNHVFLTGLAGDAVGEVRFSDQELPEVWPSGHWLRPSKKEEGAQLVCSKVCPFPGEEDGTRLVVFAKDRIYHFDGFNKSLFQIYQVKKGIGCVSKRSVVNAEGYTYWVADNGIYVTSNGGYDVNMISYNIQPTFDSFQRSRLPYCCAVHNRNKRQVWFSFVGTSIASGTINYFDRILVYHYGLSTPLAPANSEGARHVWSVYDISAGSMCEAIVSSDCEVEASPRYKVIGGYGRDNAFLIGDLMILDPLSPGHDCLGRDIVWHLKTKRFRIGGSMSAYGVLRKCSVTHQYQTGHTATLTMYKDQSTTATQTDTVTMDAGTASQIYVNEKYYNELARTAQFKLNGTVYYTPASGEAIDALEGVPGSLTESSTTLRFMDVTIETIPKAGLR